MPSLSVHWDIRDLMSAADRLDANRNLPEFIAKTVVVSLRDLAEKKAREIIGNGGFGQDLAEGVRARADGVNVTVDHASNETNHLAEHVEYGGPIRSRSGGHLAIPIDRSVKGEYARDHVWNTPDGKPLFIRKKEDGPRGRAYLAEPQGKRGKIKLLFVLVRETKPQSARHWWPTDDEFLKIAEREITWWRDRNLPAEI